MKRLNWLAVALAAVLVLGVAIPAFAGEKMAKEKDYKKCSMSAQDCLNKMATSLKNRGWLGVIMEMDEKSAALKIQKVVPGSPAEAAGFQPGDVIVSVNGQKYATHEDEKCGACEVFKDAKPGMKLDYVLTRDGKEMKLNPTLAPMPADALATIIGMHMLDHVQYDSEQAKK